ncbi:hypothetical protein Q4561_19180 [Alteromonas sp. 1_MG-2023]|uniref:hypothetical protein n=1 Tax=Alteromonas sp. 1_MG-2023 TaxID=3062669 RepID=UPI0026E22CB5|nr:hypothetical protein [Alteromonas sp. 1_MG-2023]MDO6569201.1 hypothetical protein [Alteromonas sp. 1_MG-2023]
MKKSMSYFATSSFFILFTTFTSHAVASTQPYQTSQNYPIQPSAISYHPAHTSSNDQGVSSGYMVKKARSENTESNAVFQGLLIRSAQHLPLSESALLIHSSLPYRTVSAD